MMDDPRYNIRALNVPQLSASELSDYLSFDSVHRYPNELVKDIEILSPTLVRIGRNTISIFSDRDATKLQWRAAGVEYLIDATGAYLTTEDASKHDVDHVIMSAPPNDPKITPTFIYGVNHDKYAGQKCVSASSCTTNCMAPMLKLVSDNFGIDSVAFTTIHATTGSQSVVDVVKSKARTHRSIINNMIPHSTGASKSITETIPVLKGKIWGTSVRVPTINCSLLDCNIQMTDKSGNLDAIASALEKSPFFGHVFACNRRLLTSCDFMTTVTPSILDHKASLDMNEGSVKLMMWYDNEWSYSAQCLRIMTHMAATDGDRRAAANGGKAAQARRPPFELEPKRDVRAMELKGSSVVARFDFNVPVDKGVVMDDFRVRAALPTMEHILSKGCKRMVLVCRFGRPKGRDEANSVRFLVPLLSSLLKRPVTFLQEGVSQATLGALAANEQTDDGAVYLLENIRFHAEEERHSASSALAATYQQLGDVIIADCFGCVHRPHMSIVHLDGPGRNFGYGLLVEQEVSALSTLLSNSGKRVLGIMGGAKIADKQPLIDCLCHMPRTRIFVGGGLTRGWKDKYPITPSSVIVSRDAYGAADLSPSTPPRYVANLVANGGAGFDIGPTGLRDLMAAIDEAEIIFWNGCLGVIEDPRYRVGSQIITDYLCSVSGKQVIIGGGETASLFAGRVEPHVYLSTGGGALLGHIESQVNGKAAMPGLAVFEKK